MKWYIIRHGQTDYNKRGVVQGSGIDAPLNEFGSQQAERFFELHSHIDFDKVYTSELQRTHQSIARFIERHEHHIHSGLNEISWGVKEGEEVSSDSKSYYMQMSQRWRNGELDWAIERGESPLQVASRQKKAVDFILQNGGNEILICMHGRAMRILLSQLLQTPLQEMDQYEHSNLCKYVVEWNGSGFDLIERNISIDL